MATLSLNGKFNYPIELKQSLSVDGTVAFNSSFTQGRDSYSHGDHSLTCGDACSAESEFGRAYGVESYVGYQSLHGCADGAACSAYGDYSYAMGYRAATCDTNFVKCNNSFVWQGATNDNSGNVYYAKGDGTFCINPYSNAETEMIPICGFYVGDNCITYYMSSAAEKRILYNENTFRSPQHFGERVEFQNDTEFNGGSNTFNGSVEFNGDTTVTTNNNIDNDTNANFVASHGYATAKSLSAIANIGKYYSSDITAIDYDGLSNFPPSLGLMRSYVASGLNNVDEFINGSGESSMDAAASRGYTLFYATSASTHLLSSDNVFTGTNTFDGDVYMSNNVFTTYPSATMDLRQGTTLVRDASETELKPNTIASEVFARSVATSGVRQILTQGNTYTGNDNTYNGRTKFNAPVYIYGNISLINGATANFTDGTLTIREPDRYTLKQNEASTTEYSRFAAQSSVDALLEYGGTFSERGKVTFNGGTIFNRSIDLNSPLNVQLDIKTAPTNDRSTRAASTAFVDNYVTATLATSAQTIRRLMLDGVDSGGVVQGTNNFTVDNYFLNKNIYVSTMEAGRADTHAASCEFVKNALYGVFDIFETKFMDYQLPQSSPWKLQGSTLRSDTRAYQVISEEIRSSNTTKDTYDLNGTTYNINYYRTNNGHKVVTDPGNFNVVNTVYGIIGAGWYYYLYGGVLTLPRTKCYFRPTSDISEAGNYFRPVVPQHTHSFSVGRSADAGHGDNDAAHKNMHHGGDKVCSNLSKSTGGVNNNPLYTDDNTVRPPSVGMLLYFFCG